MKKKLNLSEITTGLMDQVHYLQDLAGQVSRLETKITKITGKLSRFDRDLEVLEKKSADSVTWEPVSIKSDNIARLSENERPGFTLETKKQQPETESQFPSGPATQVRRSSNIIPFPESMIVSAKNIKKNPNIYRKDKFFAIVPFLAMPGMPLPPNVPDYRPHLQRDGLILLAWDKRETETGERYTAYWVTSIGMPRFYASKPLSLLDFPSARPHHKSYAAEDGIEFYGQEAPVYLVHIAPDLMKSNPRHGELRADHIALLESQGIKVDFNYKFLLKTEKTRNMPLKRSGNENNNKAGA